VESEVQIHHQMVPVAGRPTTLRELFANQYLHEVLVHATTSKYLSFRSDLYGDFASQIRATCHQEAIASCTKDRRKSKAT
jgi:hypothetical protein